MSRHGLSAERTGVGAVAATVPCLSPAQVRPAPDRSRIELIGAANSVRPRTWV